MSYLFLHDLFIFLFRYVLFFYFHVCYFLCNRMYIILISLDVAFDDISLILRSVAALF